MFAEQPFMRKIREVILEEKERIWDDHDREISQLQQKNRESVFKAWVLGLIVGGGISALATSYLTMYVHALSKH